MKNVEKRIDYELNYCLLLLSKWSIGKLNIIAKSLTALCEVLEDLVRTAHC